MSVPSSKSTVAPAAGHNDPVTHDSIPKDFGLFPVPRRLRYDPQKPFYFGTMLNLSFGFASTFSKVFARQRYVELMERSDRSCSKLVLLSATLE